MSDNFVGKSLGRYHIIERLGEGGMASIFKAFDTSLEREVAVKVIRVDISKDESFLRRFEREAKSLARLDHPFILKVLDYGEQDGTPYLVMPFVSGGTLKHAQKGRGRMPYNEAARLLAPVADALAYAHNEGVIHRDIKPANILVSKSGDPLLSDFGIAKLMDQQATQLTGTGISIGTPDYMAPEQWLGEADALTDIYSLGVVFYELVTGRRPYMADTPAAVFIKHREDPLPRPRDYAPDLPEVVENVIFKAMAKEPSDRYADMNAFAKALENLARDEIEAVTEQFEQIGPVSQPVGKKKTPSAPVVEAVPEKKRSRSGLIIGLVVGAVVIGCLAVVAVTVIFGASLFPFRRGAEQAGQPSAAVTAEVMVEEVEQAEATEELIEPTVIQAEAPTSTPIPQPTATEELAGVEENPVITSGIPDDYPIIEENNGDMITQNASGQILIMYSVALTMQEASDFYQEKMPEYGWTHDGTTDMSNDGMIMHNYSKGERMTMVNVADDGETIWVQIIEFPEGY